MSNSNPFDPRKYFIWFKNHQVFLGCLINVALFVLLLAALNFEVGNSNISNEALFAFSLTLVEVMLATVGIGLAILGVFGYNHIKDSAEKAAIREVEEIVRNLLSSKRY